MRQTTVHRAYVGSRAVSCYSRDTVRSGAGRRLGFTLIEVVVAMSILVIVVLAMLSSYSFFYSSVTNLRLQSIGENLAQLQLEDVRNMGIGSFKVVLGTNWDGTAPKDNVWPARFPQDYNCPNYPPAELFYTASAGNPTWYSYARVDEGAAIGGPSNLPQWTYDASSPSSGLPIPPTPSTLPANPSGLEGNLASIRYASGIPYEYDSGKRDADFVIEGLHDFTISGVSSTPSDLVLPETITVASSASGTAPYTLDISKWTYPYFKKRITITDESPGKSDLAEKLYEVAVTVYWTGTANGTQKSYTVKQKVSFEGQVK